MDESQGDRADVVGSGPPEVVALHKLVGRADIAVAPALVGPSVLGVAPQVLLRAAGILQRPAAEIVAVEPVKAVGEIGHGSRAEDALSLLPAQPLPRLDDIVFGGGRGEAQPAPLDPEHGDLRVGKSPLQQVLPDIADVVGFFIGDMELPPEGL